MPRRASITTSRAPYQALSPGSSDTIAAIRSFPHQHRLPHVQLGPSDGRDRSRRDVDRAAGVGACRRCDRWTRPPGSRAGRSSAAAIVPEPTASDCSASRPATTTRIREPSGDHACCSATPSTDGERSRLADRVGGQRVQLVTARRRAVGAERERPAVGRPPRLVVVVRAVRDLAELRAVDADQADPSVGVPLQRRPAVPRGTRSTARRARAAGRSDRRSSRSRAPGPAGRTPRHRGRAASHGGLVPSAKDMPRGRGRADLRVVTLVIRSRARRDAIGCADPGVSRAATTLGPRGHRTTRHPRRP